MRLFNITSIAQRTIKTAITLGDKVIDATAGNGNDTCFLAECVGNDGQVYAFDVQRQAIESTKKKLTENKFINRVTLIQDSHDNIEKYVDHSISAAMFNLGYLPNSDHRIITKAHTTIEAINSCINILKIRGIISICVYVSHTGGKEEGEMLKKYLIDLPHEKYKVIQYSSLNDNSTPYICFVHRIN